MPFIPILNLFGSVVMMSASRPGVLGLNPIGFYIPAMKLFICFFVTDFDIIGVSVPVYQVVYQDMAAQNVQPDVRTTQSARLEHYRQI